MFPFRP